MKIFLDNFNTVIECWVVKISSIHHEETKYSIKICFSPQKNYLRLIYYKIFKFIQFH